MSRFTSTSEFDINRRVQITNETPVYNLFEALNSTMQNDFYEWILGNEEVRYDVPYSIKQENPNGKYEDNSVAGTIGRFDIIRDEQESDGATKFERLEKNQLYYKSINGNLAPIYGPKPATELDGPNTFYHSKKMTGVILPEFDFLLHHFYRYLECLYPDHPDWTYLLTPTEFNDGIRSAGKLIDYRPQNLFFEKVAKSLSKELTSDEEIDEASMIKIHNLKDEAYRRKFYGSYAGYKMLGNDIFQHISVFPVATYLPIKPIKRNKFFQIDSNGNIQEQLNTINSKLGTDFKSKEEFDYYEKTQLRIIDTYSNIYANKFKLIDYFPVSYGNFISYKTFKYFNTLWTNSIFEGDISDYSTAALNPSNITQTSVLKDDANFAYNIDSYGSIAPYTFKENVGSENQSPFYRNTEAPALYVTPTEELPKTKIEFEVFELFDKYILNSGNRKTIDPNGKYYNILITMNKVELIEPGVVNNIYREFPKETKTAYINPRVDSTLYLDPKTTLDCYKNDKLYKSPTVIDNKDLFRIYKTTENKVTNALLLYSFTPGFLKVSVNESVLRTEENLFFGLYTFSVLNKNNEEFVFIVKGTFQYNKLNLTSSYIYDGSFRIISAPKNIKSSDKLFKAYKTAPSSDNNYERFFDSESEEILIDGNSKIVKICKIFNNEDVDVEDFNSSSIVLDEIPLAFAATKIKEIDFGWGNFLNLFKDGKFILSPSYFNEQEIVLEDDSTIYPLLTDSFVNLNVLKDLNSARETYLYGKSELDENIKKYINGIFDTLNLYSSDSQNEIIIEGKVDLNIKGGENLISFESETSKEMIPTLSIGDTITGNDVDGDDEIVFITEIGEDYIRISNDLISSGTFDFKINTKILSIKQKEDNPLDFINRLKSANEYEFYNPFQHGIYSSYGRNSKMASRAYVNGLSNINSWKPYIGENNSYSEIVHNIHNFDSLNSDSVLLPSTIKFANDLFIEYNADKILYYPTRSGKEECLMSVDWLDYLENRVNEASRLSDNTSVGVCLSLQTDMSGNVNTDKIINSKFRVMSNVWKNLNGKPDIPTYVRIGNGFKNFKVTSIKSEISGIGKSVYGNSKYSKEVTDHDFKDKTDSFGNILSDKMDYYGDNENYRAQKEINYTTYKDIDNTLFEINLGENDIILDYKVNNNLYTLIQVNAYKQTFKNLLKYSSYDCGTTTEGTHNKYSIANDERWVKILNVDDSSRNIFKSLNREDLNEKDSISDLLKPTSDSTSEITWKPVEESSGGYFENDSFCNNKYNENNKIYKNINNTLPTYKGKWAPSILINEDKTISWNYPKVENMAFNKQEVYYWIIEKGGDFILKDLIEGKLVDRKEKISDSAVLILYKKDNEKKWIIKDLIYCNNIGNSSLKADDVETRHQVISNKLPPEDYIYKELGSTYGRIFGEDVFVQLILQSLGIFENEESLKQCTWDLEHLYSDNPSDTYNNSLYNDLIESDKFTLNLIKDFDKIYETNITSKKLIFKECKKLLSMTNIKTLDDGTEIESVKYSANSAAVNKIINAMYDVTKIDNSSGYVTKIKKLNQLYKNYILVENINLPMNTVRICDLKKTTEAAQKFLDSHFGATISDSDLEFISKFTPLYNISEYINISDVLEKNIFLFTTYRVNDLKYGYDWAMGRADEKDIFCFFKVEENKFCIFRLNTDDIFSAEIPIDRFSIYGVNNEEWANIKRSEYCSIGISKRLNSTFELPRKYLNDDYEFDITINPQFIGKGYPYTNSEGVYDENGTPNEDQLTSIEISKGAIYYDEENGNFFTWTYEVNTDEENYAADSKTEVLHTLDENGEEKLKKYAIKFEENKYFKNVLESSGSYIMKEEIDEQNKKVYNGYISPANELSLNKNKISSNDKVLEIREVKLRPMKSNNEASFLSSYSKFSSKITGIDFDENKIVFDPKKMKDKASLSSEIEKLLPCEIIDENISIKPLPEGNTIKFEDERKPQIRNSSFTRLPVLINDNNSNNNAENIGPDFKYFKNNLIFIGMIDRRNPSTIIAPAEEELAEKYYSAISYLQRGDSIVHTKVIDRVLGGGYLNQKIFRVNETGLIDSTTEIYYNINKGEFIGFSIRNGDLKVYTQNKSLSNDSRISFNNPVEASGLGQSIINNSIILNVAYSNEKDSYVLEISIGNNLNETSLYEVSVTSQGISYKKLFGAAFIVPDIEKDVYFIVKTNEFDSAEFELIKKEDIKDTLQQEPGEADEESFESLLTDESVGRTLDATGYKNPTSAWEPIDDGRFIFLENKDGYGYVDSIAIKGNHLFVNSNLYKCYSDGNYTEEFTKKKYWHHFDLSSFVNNSNNFFKGKNKSEIFNFTEKSIIAAKEYLTSIGETSSSLRMTLITSLESNFKNLSIDDETINLSSTFGIYKKDGKYYFNVSSGTETINTDWKTALGIICSLVGAGDCIKRFVDSAIIDAFISGEYLFIKEYTGKISYIRLDKLYKYSDYSDISNWNVISMPEYSYETLDTDGVTYEIGTANGIKSINVPLKIENSIFDISEIKSINSEIYLCGSILSRNEIDAKEAELRQTYLPNENNEIEKIAELKAKNTARSSGSILPIVVTLLENNNFKVISGDSDLENLHIKSVKALDDGNIYFFACENGSDSATSAAIIQNDKLVDAGFSSSDLRTQLFNSKEYEINVNGSRSVCWITSDNRLFQLIPAQVSSSSSGTVYSKENGQIKLSSPVISSGSGRVRVLFSFSTSTDILNTKEFVVYSYNNLYFEESANNSFTPEIEISQVSTFHNADRVYSYNQELYMESGTNDVHYYPYYNKDDPEFSSFYESKEFKNDSGNVIRYCTSDGSFEEEDTGIVAYEPSYKSVAELNDDVSKRVLISDISAKPISIEEFNYSTEPYLKVNTSTLGDYFKNYLITGIYEIQNYITRNFSFVTSNFDADSYNKLLDALKDGAEESEIEAIEDYTFLINGYNYKLKKIEGDDNYYLYNDSLKYFPLDNDIYFDSELFIPYLFKSALNETDDEENSLSLNFSNVKDSKCTGIYIPKNGYGGIRGNTDEWIYNKPWDNDSAGFEESEYLKNKNGEDVYLVNKFGEKIASNNGEEKYSSAPQNIKITKDMLNEKYREIEVKYLDSNFAENSKKITLEKISSTSPKIYCPFVSNSYWWNNFILKVMKDASDILPENIEKLKIYRVENEDKYNVYFKYENGIITITEVEYKDPQTEEIEKIGIEQINFSMNLLFVFEGAKNLFLENLSKITASSNSLIPKYEKSLNRICNNDIIYFFNESLDSYLNIYDERNLQYITNQDLINTPGNGFVSISPSISTSYNTIINEKYQVANTLLKSNKKEIETLTVKVNNTQLSVEINLNISYIEHIETYKIDNNENNLRFLFDDTLYPLNSKLLSKEGINIEGIKSAGQTFEIDNFVDCLKISSSGVTLNVIPNTEVIIRGIKSAILMRKAKYSNFADLIANKGSEIKTGKVIYDYKSKHFGYENADILISGIGNSALKLNKIIYATEDNVENNLNDGKVHYIRMKILTAQTVLPKNEMLNDNFNDYFIEIRPKHLIEWPADRVFFNSGISQPPVRIGSKVYNNENKKDYLNKLYMNNNGNKIYECDVNGRYITYYAANGGIKKSECKSTINLFCPNTPKNELNIDSFKNRFYKKGEEANPFWQIIRIKKDFDNQSNDLKELVSILEYRRYSDNIGLFEAEKPYISVNKTSDYQEKEDIVFLNKNIDIVNTKAGKLKFSSKIDNYDYYSTIDTILMYGIEAQNTLKNKLSKNNNFKISTYEKCNYIVSCTSSNKLNNDNSIIEVSELGLFNNRGELMAYATFPPIEYRSDSQHLSFLLYIYNGEY